MSDTTSPGILFDPAIGERRPVTQAEWQLRVFDASVPGKWRIGTAEELARIRANNAASATKYEIVLGLGFLGLVAGGYKLWGTKGAVGVGAGVAVLSVVGALALANR